MENLQSNLMLMTLEENWGYSLLDFMFGEQIRKGNQMKNELLNSILPYKIYLNI